MILNVQYDGQTVYTMSGVEFAHREPAPSDISLGIVFRVDDIDYQLVCNGISAVYLMSDTGDTIASYKGNTDSFIENSDPYCKFSVRPRDINESIPPLTDSLLHGMLEKCLRTGSAYLADESHDLYGKPLAVSIDTTNNHVMLGDIDLAAVYKKDKLTVIPYQPSLTSCHLYVNKWGIKHPNIDQKITVYFEYNDILCVEEGFLKVVEIDGKKELKVMLDNGDIIIDQWLVGWSV